MAAAKKYVLTDEHRAQLRPWAERWIANAMSTAPHADVDRVALKAAIRGLYEAAGLTPPPEHRIVIVPSPFVAAFASGFAAAIWHRRKGGAATRAATRAATYAATDDATRAATRAATSAATSDDANNNWYRVPVAGLRALACRIAGADAAFWLQCAAMSWRMRNGGNQWSGWVAYLSFFRYVAKLPLDYSKWQHYEAAAELGGPRYMHPEFCIVSERPVHLTVDAERRPHHDTGPFCRWRDGTALYAWHGVRVPPRLIEQPESISADEVLREENAEIRRVMLERVGMDRFIREAEAALLQADDYGELWGIPHGERVLKACRVWNGTPEPDGSIKEYWLQVPDSIERCAEGVAWTYDVPEADYRPAVRT